MYIIITTRCNMSCSHCCMSATSRGRDMQRETFVLACRLAEVYGEGITLGGGEPTLHPLFWDFLGLAQRYSSVEEDPPLVITNGSRTEDALALAQLAKRGAVSAELSQDVYHSPIDESVVRAFTRDKRSCSGPYHDMRSIRDVVDGGRRRPIAAGRAKEWGDRGCVCALPMVSVTGNIYACGCRKVKFGNVHGNVDIPPGWDRLSCSDNQGEKRKSLLCRNFTDEVHQRAIEDFVDVVDQKMIEEISS